MWVPSSWEVLPAGTTQGSGRCLQEELSTQPPPRPATLAYLSPGLRRSLASHPESGQQPDSGRLARLLHAVDHVFR